MKNKKKPKSRYDIIIIGAGIGGLVAANYLAQRGLSIVVIEQHSLPGGYCTSFKRNGYTFDAGAHFFGSCGPREPLGLMLKMLGINNLNFLRMESIPLTFPSSKIDIPLDAELMSDVLQKKFPDEKEMIGNFFSDLRKLYRNALRNNLDHPLVVQSMQITYSDFLDCYFKDILLKKILSFMWLWLGDKPEQCSAFSMLVLLGSYILNGTYRLKGGAQKLSNCLCENITKMGGDVFLNTSVEKIILTNKAVSGVEVEGLGTIHADTIISNASAVETFSKLMDKSDLANAEYNKLKKMKIGYSPFELYIGVDYQDLDKFEGVYFQEDNVDNLVLFSVNTKYDSSIAPQGKHTAIAATVFPYKYENNINWNSIKKEMENQVLNSLENYIPGIKSSITTMESATPETYWRYTGNHNGAAYGWSHNVGQTWAERLDNKTQIPGLYLAGHWSKPGGGIVNVFFSGVSVAKMILDSN